MLYTSYYGNHRKYKNMFRVSISRTAPTNSFDIQLIKLAPDAELLQKYKSNSITIKEYTQAYHRQLTKHEDSGYLAQVVKALLEVPDDVVLLCYEKKGDFCHRHLLADWLNSHHGTNIQELE